MAVDIRATLAAIERRLAARVEIWRTVIAPDGTVIKRIHSGSFTAPPDWQPPTLEHLTAIAKGRTDQ